MIRMPILLLVFFSIPLLCPAATWYVDGSVPESGDGRSWETARKTIRRALDSAWTGDTVVVAPGVYRETLITPPPPRNFVLRSVDPCDPAVVTGTVIEGLGYGPVITFSGDEGESCVLQGFTITNGAAPDGGGINGNGTLATIRNNVITGNVAVGAAEFKDSTVIAYTGGGGLYWCNGLIENNVISDNQAGGVQSASLTTVGSGGGLFRCHGTIRNNTIVRNKALGQAWFCVQPYACLPIDSAGGGLCFCNGTVERNYIADNLCEYNDPYGFRVVGVVGIAECDGFIKNNTIVGNAGNGLAGCSGCIVNNIVAFNSGTGLMSCSGLISNNAVFANQAESPAWEAGGIHGSDGVIRNCIVWANSTWYGAQIGDSSEPAYSCIQNWTGGGEGNISEEPRFVDGEKGDFRLRGDSPCIDAGLNSTDLPEFDIAGMHRIMFGGKSLTIDMGAYEFYINTLTPGPELHQTTFTWSSLADKTYSIFYTDDLFNWHLAIDSFPSSGNQTTFWTDDGSQTGLPPSLAPKRFYRLLENP